MKKLICMISALALLVAPYNVYAQEVSGYGSADTSVTYHVDSEWCVLIPETLTADGSEYYFTASYMELCDGDVVTVQVAGLPDGFITLTNSNGGTTTAQIYSSGQIDALNDYGIVASFGSGQLTSDQSIRIVAAEGTSPGDYTGTITFNVNMSHME